MKSLDILRQEQSRRLEELEKEIIEREKRIKALDSKIKYSAEYFKTLEDSIQQLSESVRTAIISPKSIDTDQVNRTIDVFQQELSEIRRNASETTMRKDQELHELVERLHVFEGRIELLKGELGRSEKSRQDAEAANSAFSERETELRREIKAYEEMLEDLKEANEEMSRVYEEELSKKEDLYTKIADLQDNLENIGDRFEESEPSLEEILEDSPYPWTEQLKFLDEMGEKKRLQIRTIGTKGMIEEFSNLHYFNTAFLLTSGESRVLIDYGEENPGEAFLTDLNPSAVLISHGHPDHVSRSLESLECPIWMSKETDERLDPEKYDFKIRMIFPGNSFRIGDFEIETFSILHSVKFPMTAFKISSGGTSVGITTDIIGFHAGDKDKFFDNLDIWITDCSSLTKDLIRYDDEKGEPFGHLALANQLKWIENLEKSPKVFLTHFGKGPVEMSEQDLKTELSKFSDDQKLAECVDGARMIFAEGQPLAFHGDISVVNLFSELKTFARSVEKQLGEKQLKELRSLHEELNDAKNRLSVLLKKPPTSRSDIEKEIGYIQDAMVDILKGSGIERVISEKYIYSLRKVPTHFRITSEQKVLEALKKKKLNRFVKSVETIDMSELRSYLVDHNEVLPGLRKIDADVSIYIYERHEETPELVHIIAHEDVNPQLLAEMFAEAHQEYRKMAIVGSRNATENMLKAARHQAQKALESGWGIVTGGARGVDLEAIRQATMNSEYAKKLTVYLPKTLEDQPAETWELLKKAKKLGARVVENAGAHEIAQKTGQSLRTVPYGKAAMARNARIMRDASAAVAIQTGTSSGTQNAIKTGLEKGLHIKHINEKLETTLLKKVGNILGKKSLGNMTNIIKGMGKIIPGIASVLDAIDYGILWKELDNLEKDISEGTASTRQKRIWEYLQQQKKASEDTFEELEQFEDENAQYFRNHFNTQLTDEQETEFQAWLKEDSKQRGKDVSLDLDNYDVRGFWLGGAERDAATGHGSDTWKKPNHPTFSNESIYHDTSDELHGGKWIGGTWGENSFMPSKEMLEKTITTEELKKYFKEVEPWVKLVLPEEEFGETPAFRGTFDFLSNFYPTEVEFEGVVYPTAEHAYQAAKTLDPELRQKVKLLDTPGKAKGFAKQIKLRPEWDKIKVEIMEDIVKNKFANNFSLQKKLVATTGYDLVENNTWGDEFWGKSGGKGENRLGKILMNLREKYQTKGLPSTTRSNQSKISFPKKPTKVAILGSRTATESMQQATAQAVNEILARGGGVVVSGAEGTSEAAIRQALRKIKTPEGGSMEFNVPQVKTHLVENGTVYSMRPYDLATKQVIVDNLGPCIRERIGEVTDELLERYVKKSGFNSIDEWKKIAEKVQVKKVGQPEPTKVLYKVTQLPKTGKLTILLKGTLEDQSKTAQVLLRRAKTFGANVIEKTGPGNSVKISDGIVVLRKTGEDATDIVKTAVGQGKLIQVIDEEMNMTSFWKQGGKIMMKNLGRLTGKVLKGLGTVLPGISIMIDAIDLGQLWKDVDELPEKLEKGEDLNENQKAIMEQVKLALQASESFVEFPEIEKLLDFKLDPKKKEDLEDLDVEGDVEYSEESFQEKINAPTFAYQTVYGRDPPEPLRGRTDSPKKEWHGIMVDEGLKNEWLESLNNLPVEITSTEEGKSKFRVPYVMFRVPSKHDDKHEEIAKLLAQDPDIYCRSGIGNGGRPRICVAGRILKGEKGWDEWWDKLPSKISEAYHKIINTKSAFEDLDLFLSKDLEEELKEPRKRHRQLVADLFYLSLGYSKLKDNESWGDWTMADILKFFGSIVDVLRTECFYPYVPPKKGLSSYGSSFWKCYRDSVEKGYIKTKPPGKRSLQDWAKKRKELLEFSENLLAGLYLVEPHAELIWAGVKPALVKSIKFHDHINEPLYLLSKDRCWGVIRLSDPKELSNEKEFRSRYSDHLVEDFERLDWWDEKFPLWIYEIDLVEKFKPPKRVNLPRGTQVFLRPESIRFAE